MADFFTINRETIGAKLRRLSREARRNNPWVNGVMSSPPTITAATTPTITASAGTATNYLLKNANGQAAIRTFGGVRTPLFTDYMNFPVATISATLSGGNISGDGRPGNQNATSFQAEFMADAANVSVAFLNSAAPVRFLVEGPETGGKLQYVSTTGTVVNVGGGTGYANIPFASRALRRIVVEGEQAQAVVGVTVAATEGVYATEGSDILRGFYIGASFAEGTGATRVNDNTANVMMGALGIRDRRCSGLGGTGFVQSVSGTKYTFGQRLPIDAVMNGPFDVAFIRASFNDNGLSGIQAAADATLRIFRAAYARVPLSVLGCTSGNYGPDAATLAVEAAVSAAVTAFADPLTIFVPSASDSPPSVSGTGKVGATNTTGNSDLYVSGSANPHYATAGHIYDGLRGADALMAKLSLLP